MVNLVLQETFLVKLKMYNTRCYTVVKQCIARQLRGGWRRFAVKVLWPLSARRAGRISKDFGDDIFQNPSPHIGLFSNTVDPLSSIISFDVPSLS